MANNLSKYFKGTFNNDNIQKECDIVNVNINVSVNNDNNNNNDNGIIINDIDNDEIILYDNEYIIRGEEVLINIDGELVNINMVNDNVVNEEEEERRRTERRNRLQRFRNRRLNNN